MHVKVIASQRCEVFLRHGVYFKLFLKSSNQTADKVNVRRKKQEHVWRNNDTNQTLHYKMTLALQPTYP